MKDVLRTVDRDFPEFKERLVELARIPSVSAEGFPGDWKKCMRAAVHLYDELSRVDFVRRPKRQRAG